MYTERLELYKTLEEQRGAKLLVFATSDRRGMETRISSDILSPFLNHLDEIGDVEKISLYLYTRGGDTLAAWSLVNLIRNFCNDFEIIIPFNCHSAGTLICLGANRIVMTKQATLGPIDPSVNGPLNPQVPINNNNVRVPVSVEHVNAYLELAKSDLGIGDDKSMADILIHLANKIHPLTLGQVYKSKTQIQMLAKKLLKNHGLEKEKEDDIINFLCSESGSHDYTIHRREASEELGLNVEKPDEVLYNTIKQIYISLEKEMELNTPFDPKVVLATKNSEQYSYKRGVIESVKGGSDIFVSEGILSKLQMNPGQQHPQLRNMPPQIAIQDNRTFEGWKRRA